MTSTSMIEKTATFALYALAALPFIALSVAHAETATVKVSDLNLSQPAQVQEYNARVEHAAAQVCATIDGRDLDRLQACKESVRAEAQDQLTRLQAQAATVTMATR